MAERSLLRKGTMKLTLTKRAGKGRGGRKAKKNADK
jgi:hypothetical protein